MEENAPIQFTPSISFQWRILAAICVVMPGFVLFAFFSLESLFRDIYSGWFGDMPLPELTVFFLVTSNWLKWVVGLTLIAMAGWILADKGTLSFFYGALSLIIMNFLLLALGYGFVLPMFYTTFKMAP